MSDQCRSLRGVGAAAIVLLLSSMSACGINGGGQQFQTRSRNLSNCSSCSLSVNKTTETAAASEWSTLRPTGSAQLVSYEPLPESENGVMCSWEPASLRYTSLDADLLDQELAVDSPGGSSASPAAQDAGSAGTASPTDFPQRKAVRVIHDPYSDFSSVAVDPVHNEVVVTDENLFNLLVYDRTANTSANKVTEPIRKVGGLKTEMVLECGVYVDPKSGDIYAVDNDVEDEVTVFSPEARGNVAPDRKVHTPHGAFGIAVDEEHQEMMVSVEHDNAVVAYKKNAGTDDAPIRLIQGDNTLLADPHGMALDTKDDLLFVVNHGSTHQVRPPGEAQNYGTRIHGTYGNKQNWPLTRDDAVPGSGKDLPASITVYRREQSGNTAPLRVISGPKTQLDWPSGVAYDPKTDEIFVANDMTSSILVFSTSADGDVAPLRVLKGPKSLIKNPTGLVYDVQNDELWVANFGNHTATVYKPTASGDTPPLRVIRSAPAKEATEELGRPSDVAYDSKREELLVPN
jgi:DNA-binding beta-propeller fold protein YncE